MHKKWNFPLRISSVNVTKSAVEPTHQPKKESQRSIDKHLPNVMNDGNLRKNVHTRVVPIVDFEYSYSRWKKQSAFNVS